MTVLEKILNLFDTNNIKYELTEHEAVHTSHEAAKVRGLELSTGAKALVCLADTHPILIVVPGDKRLDMKKFKNLFGVKDLRMASPEHVFELTGLKIGSIPPVGKVLGLKSYYSNWFKASQKVAFNPGSHTHSIVMNTTDLLNVEIPLFGDLTELA